MSNSTNWPNAQHSPHTAPAVQSMPAPSSVPTTYPTVWIYYDGTIIQDSTLATSQVLTLPLKTPQIDTLIVRQKDKPLLYQYLEPVSNVCVIDAKGEQHQGELMDGDHSETVTLKILTKDGLACLKTFRNYQQIIQIIEQASIRIGNGFDQSDKVFYSYWSKQLTWQCLGEVRIYDGNRMIIQTFAAITLNSGDDAVIARTKIVTGQLTAGNGLVRPMYRAVAMPMMSQSVSPVSGDDGLSSGEDLRVHDLGNKLIKGFNKIPLAESTMLEGTKVYFHNTNDPMNTYAGYQVTLKDTIPACKLTIIQPLAGTENCKILGIVTVKEHRQGENLNIRLSPSTAVKVESIAVDYADEVAPDTLAEDLGAVPTKTWHIISTFLTAKITNNTAIRQRILLRYDLNGRVLVKTGELNPGQYKHTLQYIEIPIEVNAPSNYGDSMTFSATISAGLLSDH